MNWPASWYAPDCKRCPRIAANLAAVRVTHPDYHAGPVPPFGDRSARLLVVGLGPGMHGANRTGRPFTGDHAGIMLYEVLFDSGFASASASTAPDDGLRLDACRITNAVKCLPPGNKPTGAEVRECNGYLAAELAALAAGSVILALGRVAHEAILRAFGERLAAYRFAHGAEHTVAGHTLLDSYHCSRYNTNTGRLTRDMFAAVMTRAAARVHDG